MPKLLYFLFIFPIILGGFLFLGGEARAADYTVCASGCSETTIQAVFDNNDLAPGDIVEAQADTVGGNKTYNEMVTWGSNDGGDADNQVTLQGRSGDTITIDGQNTRTECVHIDSVDYVTISDLTLQGATDKNIEGSGVTNGIIIQDCILSSGQDAIWIDAGDSVQIVDNTIIQGSRYGIVFWTSVDSFVINSIISGNTITGIAAQIHTNGFRFNQADGLTFSNNSITEWTQNASFNKLIYFDDIDGLTVNNNSVAGSSGTSYYYENCLNATIADDSNDNSTGIGFYFTGTTATANRLSSVITGNGNVAFYMTGSTMTMNNCTSDAAGSNAFSFQGATTATLTSCRASNSDGGVQASGFISSSSGTITLNNCQANNNVEDGFNILGTGILTCNKCLAYNNGTSTGQSSGDGYTSHDTSTLNVYNSVAYGNMKSGAAVTGGSSGEIENCSFYDNYETSFGSGWDSTGDIGIGVKATGSWVVKNNIMQGHPVEKMISSDAVSGGVNMTSDYNDFYDSLGGSAFDYNGTLYNFLNYKIASSSLETNSINQNPLFTNASSNDFTLTYLSPAIDAGTNVSLTTDYSGNSIYGIPDIGAYEYQPPYTIGTDEVPTTGNIRIYSDGKYRQKTASTTSATADFTVTPQGGDYQAHYPIHGYHH